MARTRSNIPCPSDPRLQTQRLCVRLAGHADVRAIIDFHKRNREHLEPTEPQRPRGFHAPKAWRERLTAYHKEFHDDVSMRMFLFPRDAPKIVIGTVGLTHVVRGPMQACWLGYSLDRRQQGKGLMTEAARAVIDYAFTERNFHRIMAGYLPTNDRSGGVLKRLGFVVEGYARDYVQIAGTWRDHLLTALVNPAWKPQP